MEATSSLSQSKLLESQFGQSLSSTAPSFNVIRDSLLDSYFETVNIFERGVKELSKKFIHLAFKEIQAAKAENLQKGKIIITPEKYHKYVDTTSISNFLKVYCNIEIIFSTFVREERYCGRILDSFKEGYYEVNISSAVDAPWFSSTTEPMQKEPHLELFEEPTNIESAIKLFLITIDENNSSTIDHLIRKIF